MLQKRRVLPSLACETTFIYLVHSLYKSYGNGDCGTAQIGIPELFESGELGAHD